MTERERTLLLVAAAMTILALLTLRIGPASAHAVRDTWEAFSLRASMLQQARASLREASTLEDSGATIRRKVIALAPKLLAGTRESEAVADLAGRLRRSALRHRVVVESIRPLADSSKVGELRRVSLITVVTGDTRGILGLLSSLAQGPVVLMTTDLRIVANNPTSPATVAEELRTEVTVSGWYAARDQSR